MATWTRTETVRRRNTARSERKSVPAHSGYGAFFFIVMGITIASAMGFMGMVASVMAGGG